MEILLTAKSLMNRFLQNQFRNAGNNDQERTTTIPAWQPHNNWQILITTERAAAHNGKWKGIAYMAKSREGNILFVGCQSITAHDTKMAKAYHCSQGSHYQSCPLEIPEDDYPSWRQRSGERMWSNNQLTNWQLAPLVQDIKNLIQHHDLQLQIKVAPKLI
jgi:hypothetical protein